MLAKANYYSEQVCNIALNLYAVIRFLKYLFCTIKDFLLKFAILIL